MFRIPDAFKMEMTFDQAKDVLSSRPMDLSDEIGSSVLVTAQISLLEGMKHIEGMWDCYATGQMDELYADDSEFYDVWIYEVNAYNVVYEAMKPLFEEKK